MLLNSFAYSQAEQHFLKHSDAGSWIQDSALILSMSKEVPWYLVRNILMQSFSALGFVNIGKSCVGCYNTLVNVCICQDDGTSRIHVVGARGASGFELNVASEVFEESGRSLVRGTLDYLQGLKVSLFNKT